MSRFNDPRYLETELAKAHKGGLVIDRDRVCKGCRYDLTGLRYGGRCPECGRVIRFGRMMIIPVRDRLQDAPEWYIYLVQAAFGAMVLGSVGIVGLALAVSGSMWGPITGPVAAAWMLLPVTLWFGAVVVLCLPKPSTATVQRTAHDDLAWKAACAGSQAMWVLAAVLATAPPWALTVLGKPLNHLLAWAGVAIGLVGLGATAWLVAGFHEWMQDDDGARRMRQRTCWLILLAAVLMLGGSFRVPLGIPVPSLLLNGVDILPIIAASLVVMLVWSFLGLTRMAGWALVAKRTDGARTERLRRQREVEMAAEQDRLANAPIDPPAKYWKAPTPDRQTGHGGPDQVAGSDWRR